MTVTGKPQQEGLTPTNEKNYGKEIWSLLYLQAITVLSHLAKNFMTTNVSFLHLAGVVNRRVVQSANRT